MYVLRKIKLRQNEKRVTKILMGLLKQGTGDVNIKYMLRKKGKMNSSSGKGKQRREHRNWMGEAVEI